MKHSKWIACLEAALLSALVSIAACMCIPSAFALTVDRGVLTTFCLIASAVFSLCYTLRLGLLPPVLVAGGCMITISAVLPSLEGLLFQISRIYDLGYGLGWFYWSDTPPYYEDVTAALCLIGCLIVMALTWTVCRRKMAFFAVLLSLLPLAACLVVTDRIPETVWLFLLLLGLGVLMLSQTVRREDAARGNRLTALVTVPVTLALLLLFWAVPKETYHGQKQADQLLQKLEQFVQDLDGQAVSSPAQQTVSLGQTGQLLSLHTPVMTVQTDGDRLLYLRQQGYQMYDGRNWYNEHGDNPYDWVQKEYLVPVDRVNISTRELHLMQFVPYYADTKECVFNPDYGMHENQGLLYSYTFELQQLSGAGSAVVAPPQGGIQFPIGERSPDALTLPASTVGWAEPLALSLIRGKQTVREQAEAIAAYVRQCAVYSRGTGRMPGTEKDFARWFLEESDSGYCVHFATATAVLLRSAGIHAQYVTGYMVSTKAGQDVVVYQDQAHAWVEYYDPACGWRVLESTPAEGLPAQTDTPQYTTPTPTAPTLPADPGTVTEPDSPTEPAKTDTAHKADYIWLLLIPFVILAIIGQWQLRLQLREHRLHSGAPNARALVYWREIVRLHRILKERPPQSLYTLAQKARFSQHTLSKQELVQLEEGLRQCHKALKAKPKYLQPIYKLILAIY